MERFDLIVIGGGPGGYLCAERAAQGGLRVALMEGKHLGGTCLNEGCIPTKTLLYSAKLYRHATESEDFGVIGEKVVFDHAKVIQRKGRVVKSLVNGVASAMKANKVTVVTENGRIAGRTAEGFRVLAGEQEYIGDRLVLATGSETAVPPIPGLKEALASGFAVTNRELLDCEKLPETLAVIGGGVIGLEMACYFASVGTHVTVIEALPKIAGPVDPEMCRIIMDAYKDTMDFKLSCPVKALTADAVVYEQDGQRQELKCGMVLVSVGRKPFTAGLGLETLGVETDRGAIVTDRHMCTNVAGVYAVGDCNGKAMLAHTAYREAEVAVHHMLGQPDEVRYNVIPTVLYTEPEVADVGETKQSAEALGLRVKEIKLPMNYAGRYQAENEKGKGFIKLVVDLDTHRVLGCHMIGSYASELILPAAMMVDTELPVERLKKMVFPHPSVGEIIREALFQL